MENQNIINIDRLNRSIYWLSGATFLMLLTGWVWGIAFTPMDYQQGDGFRIIYFHVPAASLSMLIYIAMGVMAFLSLVARNVLYEQLMVAMAPIGAMFTAIALMTGAIWGKPMWGTWWVWDARLTSELLLLFLYLGAMALYNGLSPRNYARLAMALIVLVGLINLPIIHFSVEWWNTLHQRSSSFYRSINIEMRKPLYWLFLGYFCLFMLLTLMRFRNVCLYDVYQSINKNGGRL